MAVLPEPTSKKLLFWLQTVAKHIKPFYLKKIKMKRRPFPDCKM